MAELIRFRNVLKMFALILAFWLVAITIQYTFADTTATQVMNQIEVVQDAKADLVELVDEVSSLTPSNYTEATWTALQTALTKSESALAEFDTSILEVEPAAADEEDAEETADFSQQMNQLQEAQEALEKAHDALEDAYNELEPAEVAPEDAEAADESESDETEADEAENEAENAPEDADEAADVPIEEDEANSQDEAASDDNEAAEPSTPEFETPNFEDEEIEDIIRMLEEMIALHSQQLEDLRDELLDLIEAGDADAISLIKARIAELEAHIATLQMLLGMYEDLLDGNEIDFEVRPLNIANLPAGVVIPSHITTEVIVANEPALRQALTLTAAQANTAFGSANVAVRVMGDIAVPNTGSLSQFAIPTGREIHLFSDIAAGYIITRPVAAGTTGGGGNRTFVLNGTSQLHLHNIALVNTGVAGGYPAATPESNGGGIEVTANAHLVMHPGSLLTGALNNRRNDQGGAVHVNGGRFTMHGGRIANNRCVGSATRGGGVMLVAGGRMVMTGGVIEENEVNRLGGGIFATGTTTTLTMRMPNPGEPGFGDANHQPPTVRNNAAVGAGNDTRGGGVFIEGGATFNLYDGVIEDNHTIRGGGVNVLGLGSSFTMRGGRIANNSATDRGGGIRINAGATFNLHDGVVEHNYALIGGGISVEESGTTFTMHNGTISRNTSTNLVHNTASAGGGVYVENAAFVMNDGEITYNVANNMGIGVSIATTSTGSARFTMNGGRIAYNNSENTAINLQRNPLTATYFPFGWSRGGGVAIISGDARFEFFGGDIEHNHANAGGGIRNNSVNGRVQIGRLDSEGQPIGNPRLRYNEAHHTTGPQNTQVNPDGTQHSNGAGGGFTSTDQSITTLYSGEIYGNHSQRLGGAGSLGGRGQFVMRGGTVHNNTAFTHGGALSPTGTGSRITIYDGVIRDNRAGFDPANPTVQGEGDGGGVRINNHEASLVMHGGTITGNSARNGGGVALTSGNASLYLNYGEITGNHAIPTVANPTLADNTGRGGGVYISSNDALLNIHGGVVIEDNTAHIGGGVAFLRTTTGTNENINITDGIIQGNMAAESGGGIALIGGEAGTGPIATMLGGEIRYNLASGTSAQTGGSGIFLNMGSALNMSGDAQIHHNGIPTSEVTVTHIGGIFANDTASITMTGDAAINNNVSTHTTGAGGIHLPMATSLLMEGNASVDGNRSAATGGGIHIIGDANDERLILSGNSSVSNNRAASYGGGINVDTSITINLNEGATISGNIAGYNPNNPTASSADGGGINLAVNNSALNMTGGNIDDNMARNGGGVAISSANSSVTMTGGVVGNNRAHLRGGGISARGANTTVTMRMPMTGELGYGDANHQPPTVRNNHTMNNSTNSLNRIGGGGIAIENGGTLHMYDGIVSGNYANSAGGILIMGSGSTFIMHDGLITRNTATFLGNSAPTTGGGGVFLHGGAHFTMYDGEIISNVANGQGAGVFMLSTLDNRLFMYGGRIAENNTENTAINLQRNPTTATTFPHTWSRGGGVGIQNGKLYFYDGVIEDNQAGAGGGVRPTSHNPNASFEMGRPPGSGYPRGNPIIRNNTATSNNGGGVMQNEGAFSIMWYGEISGNHSYQSAGGVGLGGPSQGINFGLPSAFTMHDGVIRDNTARINSGGFGFSTSSDTRGANITMYGGYVINNRAGFDPENPSVQGQGSGGAVGVDAPNAWFRMEGGTISGNSANNGGGIAILNNTASAEVFDGIIDGNEAIPVSNNPAINTITGRGGGVFVGAQNAHFEMRYPAVISNNTANRGGGIAVQYPGGGGSTRENLLMTGGSIIDDNDALDGGGVFINATGSIFNMTGGNIDGNRAEANGGGVWMGTDTTFNMGSPVVAASEGSTLPTISNNVAINGAGVNLEPATTFTMNDGRIHSNTATANGGGLFGANPNVIISGPVPLHCAGDATRTNVTINGGEIDNNTAIDGGGIHLEDARLAINGGQIFNNEATNDGGGVYVIGSCGLFTLDGGTIGHVNQALGNRANIGGGVHSRGAISNFSSGDIIGNHATLDGGGLHNTFSLSIAHRAHDSEGTFSFESDAANAVVNISDNTAGRHGGGIDMHVGGLLFHDSALTTNILRNEAGVNGGGISLSGNTMLANNNGLTIAENEAGANGGGLAIHNHDNRHLNINMAFVTIDGAIIENNEAGNNGGGIYINHPSPSANLFLQSGRIGNANPAYGNRAESDGGGIHLERAGMLFLDNSGEISILGNHALTGNGGGINWIGSSLVYGNRGGTVDLSHNTAAENGGGLFQGVGTLTIDQHWTISNNTANGVVTDTDINRGGGGVFVTETANFGATGGSIIGNLAPNGDGGGIFTERHWYHPILRATDYNNINITTDVIFADNEAIIACTIGPRNPSIIAGHIPVASQRSHGHAHVLSNDDINYRCTEFEFIKTTDNGTTPLPGAQFHLYERNATGDDWVRVAVEGEEVVLTSGADGRVFLPALSLNGEYRLRETQAPSGFITPIGYWRFITTNGVASMPERLAPHNHGPVFGQNDDGEYFLVNWPYVPITGLTNNNLTPLIFVLIGATTILSLRLFRQWNKNRQYDYIN